MRSHAEKQPSVTHFLTATTIYCTWDGHSGCFPMRPNEYVKETELHNTLIWSLTTSCGVGCVPNLFFFCEHNRWSLICTSIDHHGHLHQNTIWRNVILIWNHVHLSPSVGSVSLNRAGFDINVPIQEHYQSIAKKHTVVCCAFCIAW